MSTSVTAPDQQTSFTLTFIYWLQREYNFHPDNNTYSHKLDTVTRDHDITWLTAAQCLALFRRQDILAFPGLPIASTEEALAMVEDAMEQSAKAARNNLILMNGYKRVFALLEREDYSPLKDEVRVIFVETMAEINVK